MQQFLEEMWQARGEQQIEPKSTEPKPSVEFPSKHREAHELLEKILSGNDAEVALVVLRKFAPAIQHPPGDGHRAGQHRVAR